MEQAALETAKLLGTASVQLLLAIGLVFFAVASVWLGRMVLAEIKLCSAQMLALTEKKIESDNKLADALEGLERVMEAAMAAVKR
jgi:hypothetical protein